MKIRITENQLQRVINEVGGYDDTEIMGSHASNVHGPLLQTLSTTIGLLNTLMTNLGIQWVILLWFLLP